MSTFRIARIDPASAQLLDHVAHGVFNDPVDPARLATYLAQSGTMLVVATDGGVVVGQAKAAIHYHPDKATDLYLDELRVAPDHQRRGIARALLGEVERWAAERGCVDAWLATAMDNRGAQRLYSGFAQSKRALIYYWDL